MMDIKEISLLCFINSLMKNLQAVVLKKKKPNEQLVKKLHKATNRKFFLKKVYSSFKDIWPAELADMQLISKFDKGIRFLLCAFDIFSKYAWVIPLKDKKVVTIFNAFKSILNDSKRKPNKTWVDQGIEFYNSLT